MSQKYLSPKLIKLIFIIAICSLLIFFNPKGLLSPVRGIFWTMAYPFQKTFYILSSKTRDVFDFLGSISTLKDENNKLSKENSTLNYKLAELMAEKKENQTLREQLNLAPRNEFNLEASFVIGQDPQKLDSWIMIDKGKGAGIENDMPVVVSDGILIGKVEETYLNSSKVKLLSDSDSAINAEDLETESKGIVKGVYGLGLSLDMVSQMDVINQGDTVITSGLGSNVPKGLLIGKIQEIKPSEDKLFQVAQVSPSVKYSKLDVVFVIKNKK